MVPDRPAAPLLRLLARRPSPAADARPGRDDRAERLAPQRRADRHRRGLEGGRACLPVGRRHGRPDHDRRELPARAGGLRDRFRLRPHARSEHRRAGAGRARHHDRRRRLARRPRLRRHRRHDRRRLRRQRELGRHTRPARRRDRGRRAGTRRAPARGLRAGRGRSGHCSEPEDAADDRVAPAAKAEPQAG